MRTALYGPDGFFVRERPADHFRTSAHSSHFARAIGTLMVDVDRALGSPEVFDLVDVGAGRGELLSGVLAALPDELRARTRAIGVEVSPRGDTTSPGIAWRAELPRGLTGLLLATEWLDNVPLDLARDGSYLDTDLHACGPLDAADAAWVERWWPAPPGEIAEIGRSRDEAWADAVGALDAGLALAVDYGHQLGARPPLPTATGFRDGREVVPAFDGTTDITCHVAIDSAAAAAGEDHLLVRQREALHRLGLDGARPPLTLASTDPAAYLRALAAASELAELTTPAGLGSHWWLLHWTALNPRTIPLLHPSDDLRSR
ncbi:SAM-dependent methyltransferase [Catellatospora sp. NPDC049609]|uniref:SAM-dependent methyltransferase n=1 Tax=Catellatospora sp. NPDC049609 TaxID=3155505 RepID=UPI0034336A0A